MSSQTVAPIPARSAKEQFDKQASHYNAQWNSWSAETLNWLIDNSDVTPNCPVLDVATGAGFTAIEFAKKAKSVIGTDVSTGMLDEARKNAAELGLTNVTFVEAPAEALPFPDETFGIVTCRIAAHHFLDVRKFSMEAARVLKPGGRFVLIDTSVPDGEPETAKWQNETEVIRDPSHVRNYTPSEWREIVEATGLNVLDVNDKTGGITIPLSDWIVKAGCTPEQEATTRERFRTAPPQVKEAFRITTDEHGATMFRWNRVVLKAKKARV